MTEEIPRRKVRHIILAGNHRQALDYMQEHGLDSRACVIVGTPHALRGLSGPLEVHYVSSYYTSRSERFRQEIEYDLAVIKAMANQKEQL